MDFGFPDPTATLLDCASEFLLGNLFFLLPLVHFPIMFEFCRSKLFICAGFLYLLLISYMWGGVILEPGEGDPVKLKSLSLQRHLPKHFSGRSLRKPESALLKSAVCPPEILLCHGSLQPWLLIIFTFPMSSSLFWGMSCSKATCCYQSVQMTSKDLKGGDMTVPSDPYFIFKTTSMVSKICIHWSVCFVLCKDLCPLFLISPLCASKMSFVPFYLSTEYVNTVVRSPFKFFSQALLTHHMFEILDYLGWNPWLSWLSWLISLLYVNVFPVGWAPNWTHYFKYCYSPQIISFNLVTWTVLIKCSI